MGLDGPDIRQFVTTAPPLAGDTEPKHTKTACIREHRKNCKWCPMSKFAELVIEAHKFKYLCFLSNVFNETVQDFAINSCRGAFFA